MGWIDNWCAPTARELRKSGRNVQAELATQQPVHFPPPAQGNPAEEHRHYGQPAGEIRIDPDKDDRVYVTAEIDGVPFKALIDTGANSVYLSHQVARALGIQWGKADLNTSVTTAGGKTRGVTFRLPMIIVEGVIYGYDMDATILENDTGTNLLGKPFLKQIDYRFEKGTGAMIMRQ